MTISGFELKMDICKDTSKIKGYNQSLLKDSKKNNYTVKPPPT